MAGLGSRIWWSLIGLWGWVRLHTCSTLSHQCAQVKPALSTRTRGSPAWQRSTLAMFINTTSTIDLTPPRALCLEEHRNGPLVECGNVLLAFNSSYELFGMCCIHNPQSLPAHCLHSYGSSRKKSKEEWH